MSISSRQDVKVWNGTSWVQSHFVKQSSSIARRAVSELGTYINWLGQNNARGIIGELGWANDHNATGDGAKWNIDAGFYLNYLATCSVRGGMDFLNWVGSSDWTGSSSVPAYVLAYYYTDSTRGDNLQYAGTQTLVSEAFYAKMGARCGINMSDPLHNAEPQVDGVSVPVSPSGYFSSANPGVFGTDYWWPKDADFAYLAAHGIKNVNIRFRWERMQPTPSGALDTSELARLTSAISAAWSHGITVVITPHNGYGYFLGTGPNNFDIYSVSQAGPITVANFVDLWTRLASAIGSLPGMRGYNLCNEPNFMGTGIPTGANLITNGTFDSDLSGGWSGGSGASITWNAAGHSAAGSCLVTANGTRPYAAVSTPHITVTPGEQYQAQCWFKQPSVQNRTYAAVGVNLFDGTGAYLYNAPFQGTRKPTTTQWIQCTIAFTIPTGCASMVVFGVIEQPVTGQTLLVDEMVLTKCTNPLTPPALWEYMTQQSVNAIRGIGDTHEIWINGFGNSPSVIPTYHASPWITDSLDLTFYDAHHYWDHASAGGGAYVSTYAAELAYENAQGY